MVKWSSAHLSQSLSNPGPHNRHRFQLIPTELHERFPQAELRAKVQFMSVGEAGQEIQGQGFLLHELCGASWLREILLFDGCAEVQYLVHTETVGRNEWSFRPWFCTVRLVG